MVEAYKIAVAIGMQDNATAVLQSLGKSLLGLGLKIKDIEGGLGRVKVAALGLGAVFAGRELIRGFDSMAMAGGKLLDQQIKMGQAGMTHLQVVKETAEAYRSMGSVRGPDIVERLQAIRELRGIVGAGKSGDDYREVNALLPNYLKAQQQVGVQGAQPLFKAIELQGGVRYGANGQLDDARFNTYLDAALRTIQASGGTIKPQDLLGVMKQAGPMARMMGADAFYNTMMTPIMEMGGQRAGTALTAGGRALFGGIMPERNAAEMARLGLYDPSKVSAPRHATDEQVRELKGQGYRVGRGGVVSVGSNALVGMDELQDPSRGFASWLNDVLTPRLHKDFTAQQGRNPGLSEASFDQQELYRLFPTETMRRIAGLFLTQFQNVQRDVGLRAQASGISGYDQAQASYSQQVDNLKHSWGSLMETLGLPAARDGATILRAIGGALDTVTAWASHHPRAAQDLERLGLAIGVLAVASGTAAIASVALGPLASGIRLLGSAVGVFGGGAAGASAIAGLAAPTGATSLALLASRFGLIGLAVGGAILALKGIDSIGPPNPHPNTNARGIGYSGRAPSTSTAPVDKGAGWGALDDFFTRQATPSRNARGLGGATVQHEAYEVPIEIHNHNYIDGDRVSHSVERRMATRASRPSPYGNSPDAMEVAPRPGQPLVSF